MKKIVIHYPFIPIYRNPVFKELSASIKYDFEFWASEKLNDKFLLTSTENLNVINIPLINIIIPIIKTVYEWQPSAIKLILYKKMDAYIVLGNPNSLSTWICVVIAKLRKIPILMWSHGYLKSENGLKGSIRKLFYQLADAHLLYGNKAKNIMVKKGFDNNSLHVIYNSLDYDTQKINRDQLSYDNRIETRLKYGFNHDSIVLIAMGRLIKKLKLDHLLTAIKEQLDSGNDVRLFLVGDGPEYANLHDMANAYKIQDRVVFYGACHKESELARLYNASDYSVVMGKVGLSAMHSLAYGIPMITNDNLDGHFPEIESVIEGETGFYFKDDDINDFNSKVIPLPYRGDVFRQCINVIEKYYTPQRQKQLIESSLDFVFQKTYEN